MNEKLSKILNDPRRVPISVGIVAFGVGIGIGYILGRRNNVEVHTLPSQLEINLDADEMAELRDRVKKNTKIVQSTSQNITSSPNHYVDGSFAPLVVSVDTIISHPNATSVGEDFITKKFKKVSASEEVSLPVDVNPTVEEIVQTVEELTEDLVTHSIFAQDDEWNYAQEIRDRDPSEPYVIHKDEFYSEERGFTQTTLTYYAGDNILVDEEDAPIYNHDSVTGPLLFGHGSGDPKVVHIRNEKRKAEYEVVREPGLYSEEILGITIENNERAKDLRHSKNWRFRVE